MPQKAVKNSWQKKVSAVWTLGTLILIHPHTLLWHTYSQWQWILAQDALSKVFFPSALIRDSWLMIPDWWLMSERVFGCEHLWLWNKQQPCTTVHSYKKNSPDSLHQEYFPPASFFSFFSLWFVIHDRWLMTRDWWVKVSVWFAIHIWRQNQKENTSTTL